jgi:hypothetical protein
MNAFVKDVMTARYPAASCRAGYQGRTRQPSGVGAERWAVA